MEIPQKHKKIDVLFDTTTLLLHMYICIYKRSEINIPKDISLTVKYIITLFIV